MTLADREKWDEKYAGRKSRSPSPPSDWLVSLLSELPRGGTAIDFAAGDAGSTLLLASRGWRVTAVDISAAGLAIGKKVAGPLPIDWVVADLDDYLPPEGQFDLAICFRFLDRKRLPLLVDRALRPGGLFIAETFNRREATREGSHITNPDYYLVDDEWLTLFPGWEVLRHDQTGFTSTFFARKPE